MPQGTKHQSKKTTKLLNVGIPGSGKTGATACLVKAGYRLIVVDFDNGVDILVNLLQDDKEALERLYYETFTDQMQLITGQSRVKDDKTKPISMIVTKGTPTAITKALNGLNRWKFPVEEGSSETYDLGSIASWGPETILMIDSLGFAGVAALRFIRQLNMHQFDNFTSQPDYGQAMDMIEGMLQLLYSNSIKCHVIVNSHITFIEDILKSSIIGLPRALGSKLPPNVGGYFNSIVHTVTVGAGKSARKVIRTESEGLIELKLPILPHTLPAELPIKDGLLTIFKTLQANKWVEEEETPKPEALQAQRASD